MQPPVLTATAPPAAVAAEVTADQVAAAAATALSAARGRARKASRPAPPPAPSLASPFAESLAYAGTVLGAVYKRDILGLGYYVDTPAPLPPDSPADDVPARLCLHEQLGLGLASIPVELWPLLEHEWEPIAVAGGALSLAAAPSEPDPTAAPATRAPRTKPAAAETSPTPRPPNAPPFARHEPTRKGDLTLQQLRDDMPPFSPVGQVFMRRLTHAVDGVNTTG